MFALDRPAALGGRSCRRGGRDRGSQLAGERPCYSAHHSSCLSSCLILLALYALARPSYRNLVLLVASLLFYVWGEGAYVLVMLAIIAVNYGLGRRVLDARWQKASQDHRGRCRRRQPRACSSRSSTRIFWSTSSTWS